MNNEVEVNAARSSKNEEVKKKILEIFLGSDYGATVSYEEINEVLMLDLENEDDMKKMKRIVSSIKDLLIDKGRILQSVRGVGWYILKPQHIASYTYRNYIVKPQRAYDKAKKILQKYDRRTLNEERIVEFVAINDLNNQLQKLSGNLLNNSEYLKNKSEFDRLGD